MADEAPLIGALLSQVAGILEEASAAAASRSTATDPSAIAQIQSDLANAAALLGAALALGPEQ